MGHAYLARTEQRFVEVGDQKPLFEILIVFQARSMLNSLPQSQRQTGWVLNELARSYMDDQKFQLAKVQYKELLELEPYRVVGMEFYASCLYRLQGAFPFLAAFQAVFRSYISRAPRKPIRQ